MSRKILGSYEDKDTKLHRLNPQSKIVGAIILSLFSIFFSNTGFFLFLTILLIVLIKRNGITIGEFFNGIRPILFVTLFTLIFQLLFTKSGAKILDFGFFEIYSGAISNSITVFFRFIVLVGSSFLLTYTTAPIEITHGIEDFMKPLGIFKVPVKDIALILSIALRFIPIFFYEIERMKNGQASKGLDVDELGFTEKLKFYTRLLIPLLLSAIKRAEELGEAMEIKGYSIDGKKTRFREYTFGRQDIEFIIGTVVLPSGYLIVQKLLEIN